SNMLAVPLRQMRAARHSQPASPLATALATLPGRAKMRPMPFRPSRRGLVPPFIAMDVLRAANEREAAGQSVIHLEVGQLGAPAYPAYRNILTALDLEPVLIEVGENAHYQPNPELLAEAGDLAGLIVASPANPTGTMIPAAALEKLSEYCHERQIRLVSDEVYHGITYEETPQTAGAFSDDAIVVNLLSKSY